MQKFDVEVIDAYFETDWNCGVVRFQVVTEKNIIDCIEYVELDGTLCTNGDSWLNISFPWCCAFDDSERPTLMPERAYFGEEKKLIQYILKDWLILHPIEFPQ